MSDIPHSIVWCPLMLASVMLAVFNIVMQHIPTRNITQNPRVEPAESLQPLTYEYFWSHWRDFRGDNGRARELVMSIGSSLCLGFDIVTYTGPRMTLTEERGISFPLHTTIAGVGHVRLFNTDQTLPNAPRFNQDRADEIDKLFDTQNKSWELGIAAFLDISMSPLEGDKQATLPNGTVSALGVVGIRECTYDYDAVTIDMDNPLPIYVFKDTCEPEARG